MKQLVKKIIPIPVLNMARKYVSQSQISKVESVTCSLKNLSTANDIPLDTIFVDTSIAEKWNADHAAIKALYGNEDTMGGVNPGDRKALYYLIMGLNPKSILEVGTHIGASTLHIARALKQLGNGGAVTSADIMDINHPETGAWKSVSLSASPKDFAHQLECLEHIEFHTGPCLELMKSTDKRFDFIFLDGDHTAQAVYKEVHAALNVLEPNGIILLHDYYPGGQALFPDGNIISGPYMALERIKKETPLIDVLPLGELPWPTKQGTNMTSLALVVKK